MASAEKMSNEQRALHALNRLGFGPRPGDLEHVRAIGVEPYIHSQLNPETIPINESLVRRVSECRTLHMTPVALFVEFERPIRAAQKADEETKKQARLRAMQINREGVEARILRAIEGPRQLQEVMTAFWFNHFNVFAGKGLCHLWTASFEETAIRPHTMGRFRDLLGATARHPAMLFYLDNWQNSAPGSGNGKFEGINENYARELMELHTLGVNGGYSQQDVTTLAHILTGWGLVKPAKIGRGRFRPVDPSGFYFDPERHDFGTKNFLGHTIRGAGAGEVEQVLDILSRHPSTAHHLSYQLAQYFVADMPPQALVDRMAQRYLATDGDIRGVLTTMFDGPEFFDPRYYRAKFKTPYEYVISSVRATGTDVTNFRPLAGTMQLLGMPIYGCLTPNGYSNTQEAWLNPDAMMMRLSFATALGTGNLPLEVPQFETNGSPNNRGYVNRTGKAKMIVLADTDKPQRKMETPDAARVAMTLGGAFSSATSGAIEAAPANMHAAMMVGSPEFMMR